MDGVTTYAAAVRDVLTRLAVPLRRIPKPGVETVVVENVGNDHFLLMRLGWDGEQRIENIVVHARIKNGKVWIEDDRTDADVAGLLLDAGVPREDIVLAFHPPEKRHLTEFAPA